MRKRISILLIWAVIIASFAGCAASNNTPAARDPQASASVPSQEALDVGFEQYIAGFNTANSDEAYNHLQAEYNQIQTEYHNGAITEQAHAEKMFDFDDKLRDAKIYVPYRSLAAYTYAVKNIPPEERAFLENNYDVFMRAYSQAHSEASVLEAYQRGQQIYKKYNLDLAEMISNIQGAIYPFALFSVNGDTVELDTDRNATFRTIDAATKEKYIRVCEQIHSIVPDDVWKRVTSFFVFASSNVSGYAQVEDLQMKTFRIGIDATSMLDANGNLAQEQREVIVHETGHMITLNDSQVNLEPAESKFANSNAEFMSRYQEDSYIYQFFSKFWTNLYEESLNTPDPSVFYQKYQDQFVSDYAAIVPEEDIAESFRVFVMSDRPVSNSIRDQKVTFFYEYDEFVKWRDEIRKALSL